MMLTWTKIANECFQHLVESIYALLAVPNKVSTDYLGGDNLETVLTR